MGTPQGTRRLKQDVFGRVERVSLPHVSAARRVACGSRLPGTGLVARLLLRRERRALLALEGCPGVPRVLAEPRLELLPSEDGTVPKRGHALVRTWLEGAPLHRAERLPRDFFERLEELVHELHRRGVCHNDLHKEQNVLVGVDGRPLLVDFQLASVHRRRGRLYQSRVGDDLRHVRKHHRRYVRRGTKPALPDADEPRVPARSPFGALWKRLAKPLYRLACRLAGTRDGEERRPSSGPWPEWVEPTRPG